MIRFLLISFLFFSYLPISGLAQEPPGFTLQQCIDYALENSYRQKSLELDIRERETGVRIKKTAFLPEIDGYVDYLNYFSDLPTYIFPAEEGSVLSGGTSEGFYPVELGLPHNMNVGLKINQVIYDQDFFLAGKFNDNLSSINQLSHQLTRQEITYSIARTFYQAASLEAQIDLIAYQFERLGRIETMLESQIRNGFARETEKNRILINRAKLITGQNQVESGLTQALDYLKFQMGMPVEERLTIRVENSDLDALLLPDTAEAKDPIQLRLLEQKLEINRLEEQQIKNESYPTLNAYARFMVQAQRDAFNFFRTDESWFLINLFGIRLDIPIVHGGEKRQQLEMLEIKNSRMELDRVQLMENLKIEYANAKYELENSIQRVNLQENNVELAREVYEQTNKLFSEGLVQLNELLEAESAYREMQSELIKARYDKKLAELKFLNTTGNLLNFY